MKFTFTSLLCHRDVGVFIFNHFTMRAHLDHGFEIPHLILHDGSLTEEDWGKLSQLPNVILEKEPIRRYPNVYKDIYWGKLECLKRAFEKHRFDRAVLFDCDIFFLRNWESDLRKILTERAVVLRDWGSSIGPEPEKFYQVWGCREDLSTPNCNNGVISILKEDYTAVENKFIRYRQLPEVGPTGPIFAEDQCAIFTTFYGNLSYVNGIKCLINNLESDSSMWEWALQQNAVHLMGMRVRPKALCSLVDQSLKNLPETLHLEQINPLFKKISWGLLEYGHYSFNSPLHKIPSTYQGKVVNDALYLHGGSEVLWVLPRRLTRFQVSKIVCLDSGIPTNVKKILINDQAFSLGNSVDLKLNGSLEIKTEEGPGTHLAFIEPKLVVDRETWPDLSLQKEV